MIETDICILGGGVMGLATGYALSKSSKQNILLIDRYGISNEFCSSNDVNRVFRYAYGNDKLYTRMAVESRKLWRKLEEASGKELLVDTGFLLMKGEEEEWNRFAKDSYKILKSLGLRSETLDNADIKKRFPQFSAENGVLDPYAGALFASKILEILHSQVMSGGCKILQEEQAVHLRLAEKPEVETASGQKIRCTKLIITTGVWSSELLREGLTKIRRTRQHLIYFQPANLSRFQPPQFPIFFVDNYYGIPAIGIDGVKATYHGLPEEVDPETAKRSVDLEVIETLRGVLRRYIPELAEGKVVHSKVCIYDMTENSDFVIDTDPDYPNVVYGYGFSGHGFKFAPFIGQLLAELALESPPSFPLDRFSCAR